MTDTTPAARSGSAFKSPAALLGAGVLVAALGATAGWVMHNSSTPSSAPAATAALAPNEALVQPAAPASMPASAADTTAVAQAPAPAPVPVHHHHKAPVEHERAPVVAQAGDGGATNAAPVPTQHIAVCQNCGIVEGVRAVQQKGQGSGLGAVAGGVLGGVIGHQLGGGHGKQAMTVLGAIGGGLAGNEVEKRARATTIYEVRVRMDDGSERTLTQNTPPAPGAHVVVEGNSLRTVPSHDGQGA
jgi:outer membrane lipoprotein SlyB